MFTLKYDFNLPDGGSYEYEYMPSTPKLLQAAAKWLETPNGPKYRKKAAEYGYNLDLDDDLLSYAEQDDNFEDFAYDYFEEIAERKFERDPDVAEAIADAAAYEADPYAYYGVSREDFY